MYDDDDDDEQAEFAYTSRSSVIVTQCIRRKVRVYAYSRPTRTLF